MCDRVCTHRRCHGHAGQHPDCKQPCSGTASKVGEDALIVCTVEPVCFESNPSVAVPMCSSCAHSLTASPPHLLLLCSLQLAGPSTQVREREKAGGSQLACALFLSSDLSHPLRSHSTHTLTSSHHAGAAGLYHQPTIGTSRECGRQCRWTHGGD